MLVIVVEGRDSVFIYHFCGLYRYLKVTDKSECITFDDYTLLNLGYITEPQSFINLLKKIEDDKIKLNVAYKSIE